MKLKIAFPLAFLVAGAALTGCSNKNMTPKQAGEVEILEYCSGSEYKSDKNHFRATSSAVSMNRETAKKVARSNAENKLARSIMITIESVTDNYVDQSTYNNKEEVTTTFKDLARSTVDQVLSGAITSCERLTQKANGDYVSYIAVELSATELVGKYNERLSQDERIRAEYNYEQFKETFEAEMAKQR